MEHFGQRLRRARARSQCAEDYRSKLDAYARRLEIMRRQRLKPDLPVWPAKCFYPMNKRRAWGTTGSSWISTSASG